MLFVSKLNFFLGIFWQYLILWILLRCWRRILRITVICKMGLLLQGGNQEEETHALGPEGWLHFPPSGDEGWERAESCMWSKDRDDTSKRVEKGRAGLVWGPTVQFETWSKYVTIKIVRKHIYRSPWMVGFQCIFASVLLLESQVFIKWIHHTWQ